MNSKLEIVSFVPLSVLASQLALPEKWLKAEADAGRIPHLLVCGRRRFHVATVRSALLRRAAESGVANEK